MGSRDLCWVKRDEILRRSSGRGFVWEILSKERIGVAREGEMGEEVKSRRRDLVRESER